MGAEVASIFPDKLETKGELVVMKSAFGSGYTMFGTHPELRVEGVQFSEEVKMVRQMRMKVTTQYNHRLTHNFHVSAPNLFCTAPPNPVRVAYNYSDRFMEAEGLGVKPPRRCPACRGCRKCSFRGQQHTERETMEYAAIEQGICYRHADVLNIYCG